MFVFALKPYFQCWKLIILQKVKGHRMGKTGLCACACVLLCVPVLVRQCACASVYACVYFIYDVDLLCNVFAFLHHGFHDKSVICPTGWAKMLILLSFCNPDITKS